MGTLRWRHALDDGLFCLTCRRKPHYWIPSVILISANPSITFLFLFFHFLGVLSLQQYTSSARSGLRQIVDMFFERHADVPSGRVRSSQNSRWETIPWMICMVTGLHYECHRIWDCLLHEARLWSNGSASLCESLRISFQILNVLDIVDLVQVSMNSQKLCRKRRIFFPLFGLIIDLRPYSSYLLAKIHDHSNWDQYQSEMHFPCKQVLLIGARSGIVAAMASRLDHGSAEVIA